MGTGIDRFADGFKVQGHDLGIGFGHHEGCGDGAAGAGGAEEIGPTVSLIPGGARAGAAPGPDARQGALLADAGFVLEPYLDRLAAGFCGECCSQRRGEVFLNASSAAGSASGCCGRTDRRR